MKRTRVSASPGDIMKRFSHDELRGQFLLAQRSQVANWRHFSVGDWHLSVEAELPTVPVVANDEPVGWLLGRAVSADGRFIHDKLVLPNDNYEDTISSLGGRFLVIVPTWGRIYPDSCGLLSAIYCPDQQIVASSPALLPSDWEHSLRSELLGEIGIPYGNGAWPVGMTAQRGIHRLLPNHYLDLATWTPVRHWPTDPLMPIADLDSAIGEISGIIKQQIDATCADGPAMLRLTAGRDSRMLLACSRRWADGIEATTADLRDVNSSIDCRAAGEIARVAGVPHRVLPWIDPDERDLEVWLYRTGFGTGVVRGWQGTTTYRRQLDGQRSDLHGIGGEVARGHWWRRDDLPGDQISASRLLSHCRCPESSETLRFVNDWLRKAPSLDALQLLDLFYLEQRLGCWAGVWIYAETGARYQSFPMAHRRVVELVMGLPADVRRSGAMHEKVIEQEWPELLSVPFNRGSGVSRAQASAKRLTRKAHRWLRDPKRAVAMVRARSNR